MISSPMIRFNFDEQRAKTARRLNKRKITMIDVSNATGIAVATLSRLNTGKTRAIQFSTLETLCRYFECEIGDLMFYMDES